MANDFPHHNQDCVMGVEERELASTHTGLELVLGHCSGPSLVDRPTFFHDAGEQGTLKPTVISDGKLRYEFAEHRFLGDILVLPDFHTNPDKDRSAPPEPLTLKNGLRLTYGQINGLAGDFFGSRAPICKGGDMTQQKQRFLDAFSLLASDKGKEVAEELLSKLKREIDLIAAARREGKSVSEVYANLEDQSFVFDEITKELGSPGLDYIELAKINYDHFGTNARLAYNAGHALALAEASQGTIESLEQAYAINAFADHFLEDSFASGHMRVPREALSGGIFQNACAKLMHDEENRLGIFVVDQAKQTSGWYAFGDAHLFDKENSQSLQQCLLALKQSIKEVHDCYLNKTTISESEFKAFQHAASVESINSQHNNFAPLFTLRDGKVYERKDTSVTVADTNRQTLSAPDMWSHYEPIVGRWSWSSEVSWAITAYKRAPEGTIKKLVYSWLRSKGIPVP